MLITLAPWLTALLLAQSPTAPTEEPPRGLRRNEPGACAGYTLFAPLGSKFTHLVDMQGREVHRWASELGPSAVYLLADGSLLRSGRVEGNKTFDGGGICGRVERIGWDGELLWSYTLANEDQTQHHDACPMPNGNVLLITWEFRYREDAIAAGRDVGHITDKGLWPDAVLEVKPTGKEGGEVVWEWHAWDHLVQDLDPSADNHGSVAEHPELIDVNYDHRDRAAPDAAELERQAKLEEDMRALGYSGGGDEDQGAAPAATPPQPGLGPDWLHTNSVAYDAAQDLILLSSPHLSEIWILDHSTTSEQAASHRGGKRGKGGDLLWRYGNPKNHGAGGEADRRLFFQHNAHWIPAGCPGAGHLLVFNNGQGRPGGEHSTVEELALPLDASGAPARSGKGFALPAPVWSYAAPQPAEFYASFISGSQRLPNGDTLICEGPRGRIFEVSSAGAILWEYWNPYGGDLKSGGGGGGDAKALFRATRIAPDHPGLKGRELKPL